MEKRINLDSNVSAAAVRKRNGDRGGQASQKGCSSRESKEKHCLRLQILVSGLFYRTIAWSIKVLDFEFGGIVILISGLASSNSNSVD